jgi:hypothetical protein
MPQRGVIDSRYVYAMQSASLAVCTIGHGLTRARGLNLLSWSLHLSCRATMPG